MKSDALLLVGLLGTAAAWGGSFQQAFDAALLQDATFQAARADLASNLQNLPIARAGLRPSLSLNISDSKIHGSRTIDSPPFPATTTPLNYRSPTQSLNLRAPLYNRELDKKIEVAQAQENYAQAILTVRRTELLDRLAKAWLDGLLAEHSLQAAYMLTQAGQTQTELARRRLKLGEGTRPELADAESAQGIASNQIQEALAQRNVAVLTLQQMTGLSSDQLAFSLAAISQATSPANPRDMTIPSDNLGELLASADSNSASIAARRYAVAIARAAVARADAGHYPKLDFVANLSKSSNESVSSLNQSASQSAFGFQLNWPLYNGGAVNAATSQALADQARAEAELVAEQQNVAREVTRYYYAMVNGAAKIKTLLQATAAARLALEGAEKGLVTGFTSQQDVTQSQRRVAQSRQDWAQAVQDYLLARVRLQTRAGVDAALTSGVLDELISSSLLTSP
jgi:outer membrane protein, protease secretion system